jgi:hypothetical protein
MALPLYDLISNINKQIKSICCKIDTILNGGGLRPYKVYTALLTQSGGDFSSTTFGDEPLLLGVTYIITANPDNYDLTPYGAPNSNVGTSFVSTSDGVPLPYTVSLELSFNQGAPVVTVLENTIGNIWWTYATTGVYQMISNGLFITNKTFILNGTIYENVLYNKFIGGDGSGFIPEQGYSISYNTDSTITLRSISGVENLSDSVITPQQIMIEIRVYN